MKRLSLFRIDNAYGTFKVPYYLSGGNPLKAGGFDRSRMDDRKRHTHRGQDRDRAAVGVDLRGRFAGSRGGGMLSPRGSRIALPVDRLKTLVITWDGGNLDAYVWGDGPPYVHHVGDRLSDWFGDLQASARLDASLTRRLGERTWRIGASRAHDSGVLRMKGEDPQPTIVIALVEGVLEACPLAAANGPLGKREPRDPKEGRVDAGRPPQNAGPELKPEGTDRMIYYVVVCTDPATGAPTYVGASTDIRAAERMVREHRPDASPYAIASGRAQDFDPHAPTQDLRVVWRGTRDQAVLQ